MVYFRIPLKLLAMHRVFDIYLTRDLTSKIKNLLPYEMEVDS